MLLLCVVALLTGCSPPKIDSTYGRRRGANGEGSLNGTKVMAEMYRDRGCRVRSTQRLSPRLDDADVIVWVPDDFDPPTGDQRDFLETWLYQGGKTLIYVGRDFDAAPLYYDRVAKSAPANQLEELLRREALARSEHELRRTEIPNNYDAEWFTVKRADVNRRVTTVEGPWSGEIDAGAAEIYTRSTLDPPPLPTRTQRRNWNSPPVAETLLSSGGDPLIFRLTSDNWYGSEILVVANGSMVLNLPLVNQENRKLAGRLIDQSLPAEEVVFLESGPGGPAILDSEPQGNVRSGWEAFTVYPLGVILMHLAVAGILFCFSRYAIFGRPRVAPATRLSDFGHHIAALGRMMEHTGDAEYARARLRHYNQTARRDSGTSHIKKPQSLSHERDS